MSRKRPDSPRPSRDLRRHRRQTERHLLIGLILLLLIVGGALIGWNYGWGGLVGGITCILAPLGLAGLLWLILTLIGRWAEGGNAERAEPAENAESDAEHAEEVEHAE